MIITAYNPDLSGVEKTFLAQSYNAGVTSIEVSNNTEFSTNNRILIGEMGMSSSEIVTVTGVSVNGTTLVISGTLFSHEADSPVYQLQFDQVEFYRSTTGINGTYTILSTVNIDVTNENLQTTYNDLNSLSGYYYTVAMYNSISAVASAQSDPIPATTGWARNQVGYLVNQILEEITDQNEQNVTSDQLIGYFNEVNDDLLMQVVRPYNFLAQRIVIGRTAGANSLPYPKNADGSNAMWKFGHMDYNFVDNTTTPVTNTTYTVEVAPSLEYFRNRWISNENDTTTQNDSVEEIALDDVNEQFVYHPASATTSNAVWYLYYWTTFPVISSLGDTFITPTPRIYKLYALYKYYLKRSVNNPDYLALSKENSNQYVQERARYSGQRRRDSGTPRRMESEGWVRKSFRR